MRRERLERALLNLYPPAWRARYGDELLAFLEDSGLTLQVAFDVVAAATVERVRSLSAVMRDDTDLVSYQEQGVRQSLLQLATFMGLNTTLTLSLVFAGFPWPGAYWWWQSLLVWTWRAYPAAASGIARGVSSFLLLLAAFVLTGLAWVAGSLTVSAGIEPTVLERGLGPIVTAYLLAGLVRGVYIFYQLSRVHIRWEGVSQGECLAWRVAAFLIITVLLQVDPGEGEGLWASTMLLWMVLHTPSSMTPAGIRKRRANNEKIYGPPTAAASLPDQPA